MQKYDGPTNSEKLLLSSASPILTNEKSLSKPTTINTRTSSRPLQSRWLQWKYFSLLLGCAWEVEVYRSYYGWKFSMSIYTVVSNDSLVVKYVKAGDIEGLQRLFSAGEASPYMVCAQEMDFYEMETHGAQLFESWGIRSNLLEVCQSSSSRYIIYLVI